MEAYLILSYSNKMSNVSFLKTAMQEVIIIFSALSAKKHKYIREIFC